MRSHWGSLAVALTAVGKKVYLVTHLFVKSHLADRHLAYQDVSRRAHILEWEKMFDSVNHASLLTLTFIEYVYLAFFIYFRFALLFVEVSMS